MPRHKCCRRVEADAAGAGWRPANGGAGDEIVLALDELEAIRLADYEGLYQDAGAERMQVSRQTFGRILTSARRKVASALVEGCPLAVAPPGPEVIRDPCGRRKDGGPRCGREGCGGGRRRRKAWAESNGPEGISRMTNIAVGCTEDGRIAAHFPRSTHFQVFSVEDGDIRAVTTSRVAPALGTIGQHRHQGGDHDGHEGHHNHDGLLGALEGCSIVVSGGMGAGIAGTLTANGIEPIVVAGEYTPEDAVKAYLAGNLVTGAIHACCGHQHHA